MDSHNTPGGAVAWLASCFSDNLSETWTGYSYTPLQQKGNIRLLRLLPNRDKRALIQCRIFEYPLEASDDDADEVHLYEALSYVWGAEDNLQTVYIQSDNGNAGPRPLLVTENLFVALTHLRSKYIERTLWIDAVCIHQKDDAEKSQQVQMMARVYHAAARVVVWLGTATDDDAGDEALRRVHDAAGEKHAQHATHATRAVNRTDEAAIVKLLERPWFRRIWVLQEVAAARDVLIRCGSVETNGNAFCSGLSILHPFKGRQDLQNMLLSVAHLVSGASNRPRYGPDLSSGRFSLNVRPLAELISMFQNRAATDPRDRVYALLGMCSDDPGAKDLVADYTASWQDVSKKALQYALSDKMAVTAQDKGNTAIIRGRACVLGRVLHVFDHRDAPDKQNVSIYWRREFRTVHSGTCSFAVDASVRTIQRNDVVVLLQGAMKPTIVRPCDGYCVAVVLAARLAEPTVNGRGFEWSDVLGQVTTYDSHLQLVWKWDLAKDDGTSPVEAGLPTGAGFGSQECLDRATVLWNFGMFLADKADVEMQDALEHKKRRFGEAAKYTQMATEAYRRAVEGPAEACTEHELWADQRHKEGHGLLVQSLAAASGDEANFLTVLNKHGASPARDLFGRTPLLWAVMGGSKDVVELAFDTGTDIDAVDNDGWSALLLAAEGGHDGILQLLLDRGAAIKETTTLGRGALQLAAGHGHDAVVRLLLDKGVDVDEYDGYYGQYHTALAAACLNGHASTAKILLNGGASTERHHAEAETPLVLAASEGHRHIVRLLLDHWASIDKTGHKGIPALSRACVGGHRDVVKLLLGSGADIELADTFGATPFLHTCRHKHIRIFNLLVSKGAHMAATTKAGETALWVSCEAGHLSIVQALLEMGADVNIGDARGRTPLMIAAWHGREDIIKVLLDKGAEVDTQDEEGMTALAFSVEDGHDAVAQLLVDNGANTKVKDRDGLSLVEAAEKNDYNEIVRILEVPG